MTKIGKSNHVISGAFIFLLLGIFAVFSTLMVVMAAKAYRGTVDRSDINNRTRIASSYIRTMLRSDDEAEALRIEELEGVQAVSMLNTYDEESYVTRIYVYDGSLREWFSSADMPFDPKDGETVCAADSLSAVLENGILRVMVTENGIETEIDFAPRTVTP